jgi:integrase
LKLSDISPRHLGTDYVFWKHETETRFVSIKRAWKTTLRKAKITGFRFHDLRHTFASHVQMGLGTSGPHRRSWAMPTLA